MKKFCYHCPLKNIFQSIMSSGSSLQGVPRRQYVSTGVFTNHFFTYRQTGVSASGSPTFVLAVARAGDVNNPKGHILRENGRKLLQGVNPSLNHPINTTVQYTYLVGVIDTTVYPNVAGFIDPNCPVFAPFNTDKPYFLDSPVEAKDASTGLQDLGPSVYTRGDASIGGNLILTSSYITTGASPLSAGSALVGTLTLNQSTPIVVNTTAVKTTSIIFLSRNVSAGTPGHVSITSQINGQFAVTGSLLDTSTINWLIVNTV